MQWDRNKTKLGDLSYKAIARLNPGTTIAQANADQARLPPIAIRSFPAPEGFSPVMLEKAQLQPDLRSLKQDVIGDVSNVLWVLMASIAMRRRKHDSDVRYCRPLRRHLLWRVSTHARNGYSHGIGREAERPYGDVCQTGVMANWRRYCVRRVTCICGDAAHVVTAVRRELERSVDLRWNHRMRHCCTVPRMLPAFAPGSDYRPREYPAGWVATSPRFSDEPGQNARWADCVG